MAKRDWKEKFEKEHSDFVDVVQGLSVEQLDNRLLQYAKEFEAIRKSKEEKIQAKLDELAEEKKTLSGPFKDAATANGLKQRYLVHLIEEKGGKTG